MMRTPRRPRLYPGALLFVLASLFAALTTAQASRVPRSQSGSGVTSPSPQSCGECEVYAPFFLTTSTTRTLSCPVPKAASDTLRRDLPLSSPKGHD